MARRQDGSRQGLLCLLGLLAAQLQPLLATTAQPSSASLSSRHSNNWAVLVSTSRFWLNYRHIVNTMSIYHVVKRLGIPDSNIILMIPDDMACNPRNPLPAQLFNNESRKLDVYGQDVEVDYRGYEVTVANFLQVLTGRHAPEVPLSRRMLSDNSSNVLVYLSGHGGDEFMKFNDVEELLAQDLADALAQMSEKGRFREMLLIVETCQAATLVQRVTAPNTILVACSQKGQQSLSFKSDPELGLSLIDRFTYQTLAFFENMDISSNEKLSDLFKTYSYDLMESHFSYRMTNTSRKPENVQLTDFFGAVADVRTGSQRGPQDHMLHGDQDARRFLMTALSTDSPDTLDSLLLRPPDGRLEGLASSSAVAGMAPNRMPTVPAGSLTLRRWTGLALLRCDAKTCTGRHARTGAGQPNTMWTLLLSALCLFAVKVDAQGTWMKGRGTMYGNDAWSIHKGSCGYGYIYPTDPLGWNVMAMPDVAPEYADSCGSCYEVKCDPSTFTDGYGQALDRTQACYDADASLVFRVTDTCPCVYPENAYSNKRWCCGDMPHFDLSIWGFERLASTKWGVIGLKYRSVPCDYVPMKGAPTIANPTPGEQPPSTAKQPVRDWPELANTTATSAYSGGLAPGWSDQSYNVKVLEHTMVMPAMNGNGSAMCTSTQPKGAISLKSPSGAFQAHVALELWIYMGTESALAKGETVVTVGGPQGDCSVVDLADVRASGFKPRCTGCDDYYWRFEVYLSAFAGYGPESIINNANYFRGCGGNTVSQLNYVEVRNYRSVAVDMCVDHIALV